MYDGEVLVTHFPLKTNFFVLATVLLVVLLSRFNSAKGADPRDSSSTRAVSHVNEPSLLERESLVFHVESGKYSQVRIKPEVKVLSHDFFTRYAKDFDLTKDEALKLVLSRANTLHRAKSKKIIRYQQHYKNLPVVGMQYVLQTDAADHVLTASGKIISGLKVDTNPSIPESRRWKPRNVPSRRRFIPGKKTRNNSLKEPWQSVLAISKSA